MHLQSNRAKNSEKESSKGKLYLKGEQTVKTANLIRLSLNLRGASKMTDCAATNDRRALSNLI